MNNCPIIQDSSIENCSCNNVFKQYKYTIQKHDGRDGVVVCYRRVNNIAYFRNEKQRILINFREPAKTKVNIGDMLIIE